MFNKNTYMIPHGSSPSTSVLDVNVNEILLHHHDIFSGHYLAAAVCPPPDSAAAGLFNQDIGEPSGTIQNSTCPRTPKRDRHSKIDTAQGPRDRRVRLSIGVARKFFDLQEMLGFDKPSKTLDWLLTKSKSSIKDLVHTKQQSNNPSTGGVVSSPSDECNAENDEYALDTEKDSKGKSVITSNNNNKLHCKGAAGSKDPAKESRVKARARARERTREKMCIKQLNETRNATSYCDLMNNNPLNNNNTSSSSTNIPIQYMNNQLEFCKISGSNSGKLCGARDQMMVHYPTSTNYQESAGGGDLIQESIVIKRKVKNNNNNNNHHHPPSILGFQPNLILSSSNYGVPFSGYNYNNATDQNWDVGGFNSSENLSAILDHHKFNNR